MKRKLTLEYWIDDEWYVGRIREVPGVFSQGESLEELEENVRDAYDMIRAENSKIRIPKNSKIKELVVQV